MSTFESWSGELRVYARNISVACDVRNVLDLYCGRIYNHAIWDFYSSTQIYAGTNLVTSSVISSVHKKMCVSANPVARPAVEPDFWGKGLGLSLPGVLRRSWCQCIRQVAPCTDLRNLTGGTARRFLRTSTLSRICAHILAAVECGVSLA